MSFNVESLCVMRILTPRVPSCHSFHSLLVFQLPLFLRVALSAPFGEGGHCCICPSQAGIIVEDKYTFLCQSERLLHLSIPGNVVISGYQPKFVPFHRFLVTVVLISSFHGWLAIYMRGCEDAK